ncbi:MAG: hypothetical protein SGI77_26565 [Pirellulaceae bacterium]|nr:hypothetical protein [Pirellulaceae bacterium]
MYSPYQHKTQHHGKTRVIVLASKSQAVLAVYMNGNPELFCFSPKRSVEIQLAKKTAARVTPMSCGNKPKRNRKIHGGPCYTADSYRRAVHRDCELVFGKDGIIGLRK